MSSYASDKPAPPAINLQKPASDESLHIPADAQPEPIQEDQTAETEGHISAQDDREDQPPEPPASSELEPAHMPPSPPISDENESATTQPESDLPDPAQPAPDTTDEAEVIPADSAPEGWQNLPSSRAIPYWKADSASLGINYKPDATGTYEILGASQRGRSHAHTGTCRDDDLLILPLGNWVLLAVADGAGSAAYAREGSRLVCQSLATQFKTRMDRDPSGFEQLQAGFSAWQGQTSENQALHTQLYSLLGNLAMNAFNSLVHEAASEAVAIPERSVRDYATTLVLALVCKTETGWGIGTFSVGDSLVALLCDGESARVLCKPDSGEYAGQTRFLTSPGIFSDATSLWQRFDYAWTESLDALLLMTDGISDPKFPSEAALQEPACWRELWEEIETVLESASDAEARARALLEWLDFHVRGEHDDRTLVVLR